MFDWKTTVESKPIGYAVTIMLVSGSVVACIMLWVQSAITARKDAVIQQKDAMIELLRAQASVPLAPSASEVVTAWQFAGPVMQEIVGCQNNLLSPGALPTLNVLDTSDLFEAKFSVSCGLLNPRSYTSPPLFALGYAIDGPPGDSLNHERLHVIQTGGLDLRAYYDEHLGGRT